MAYSTCEYCGRSFDSGSVFAFRSHYYCSRQCELRAKRAQEERDNAEKIADAADNAARASRIQAEAEQERADAERERAYAEREKAEAYRNMQRSQENIEKNRQKDEKIKSNTRNIQERAREEVDDLCQMFVTRNGIKYREATGGSSEYRMRTCTVSEFSGGSETCRNSSSTCKLTVSTLLNKTPKGSGCLHFNLYYLPYEITTPFIEKTEYFDYENTDYDKYQLKAASGLSYWQVNDECETELERKGYDCCISPDEYFFPIYKSDNFSLSFNENLDNRTFTLKRTNKSLVPGIYMMHIALIETLSDETEQIVAWCTDVSHTTKSNQIVSIDGKRLGKIGEASKGLKIKNISLGHGYVEKSKAGFIYGSDVWKEEPEEDSIAEAPADLFFTLDLTNFETGEKLPTVKSDLFRVSFDGRLMDCSITCGCLKTFEVSLKKNSFYTGIVKLFELDENGNGRCLDQINKDFSPSECKIVGNYIGSSKTDKIELKIEDPEYSISGDKVKIQIKKIINKSKYSTGSIMGRLEYETNGKRTSAAEFYVAMIIPNFCKEVERIIDYKKPADYCKESKPVISIYTLNDKGVWVRQKSFSYASEAEKDHDAEWRRQYAEQIKLKKQKENEVKKQKEIITKIITYIGYFSISLWQFAIFSYFGLPQNHPIKTVIAFGIVLLITIPAMLKHLDYYFFVPILITDVILDILIVGFNFLSIISLLITSFLPLGIIAYIINPLIDKLRNMFEHSKSINEEIGNKIFFSSILLFVFGFPLVINIKWLISLLINQIF